MISLNLVSEPDNPIIRVLIVDDTPQVRRDLCLLLQLSSEVEVVGEAANGREAIRQAEMLHPDVIVMDINMPILDGFQATCHIKRHEFAKRVVILSVHSEPEDIDRAIEAGADTFIEKGSPYVTLIESILSNKP